tara:strand:+ start:8511 stop:10508 length:1998 start_codon:yes stop_codon:yes gene_type:complete
MARFVTVQTNFTSGELDPLLRARVDLATYGNSLEKATNIICQPQGGITRRPGTRYLTALPNTGAESAANGSRLVSFEFSTDDSYMLCFTHNRMHVFKNGALVEDINGSGNDYLALTLPSASLNEMCWTQSADTLIVVHEDIAPIKIVRGGSDATWTASTLVLASVPKYAFTIATFDTSAAGHLTPSAVSGKVTLTSQHAIFTSAHVGQYINVKPQGRAKIIEFKTTTQVNVVTEFPFFSTSVVANADWDLEIGYEAVWSATKGYPRTVTFHQGRLYFGGSKSRPSTIWGSKVGLFFDFEGTEGFDDDAVEATLDTNTYNAITDMISTKDLQVFTTGSEFFVPQQGLEPITPAAFFLATAGRNGSKPGIRVQQLESGVMFIHRQGKMLNEVAYNDTALTYLTSKISLLAGHLLKTPKRIALRRGINTDENDLLFIVNELDGTMAAFSLIRSQNVIAPSEFITTNGQFIEVGIDIDDIYTVVKRTIEDVDQYYIEKFEKGLLTDCATTGGAASSVSAPQVAGETVNLLLDELVQANEIVASGGAVSIPRASTASFETGLPIMVEARTMPVEMDMRAGTRIGFKKRIVEVNAMVLDTQHMEINGKLVPFRTFDTAGMLDSIIPDFTGTKVIHGILGYSTDARITITQSLPLKFTLLGMEYKIAVNQGT